MKYIRLAVLALAVASVLSGMGASTATAYRCSKAEAPNTAKWADTMCNGTTSQTGAYVRTIHITRALGNNQYCAEVYTNEVGSHIDRGCVTPGRGLYIRIISAQRYQMTGNALEKGAKAIKLQLKGTATLTVPNLPITIECQSSLSEGADIEGQGKNSGRDKGHIAFKECKTSIAKCTVVPFTTNQTKSRLALSESNQGKVLKDVDVFEPAEGLVLLEFKLESDCGVLAGKYLVDGTMAAELGPENTEVKEGLWSFPSEPITTVYGENEEEEVGLKTSGSKTPTTLKATYGAKLESGEEFGVGG
jgi:hypothetical protein